MNRIYFHSSDLDGHCSGAICKMFDPEAELVGMNYDKKFPFEDITPEDEVYMVDFSLEPFEGMISLKEKCKELHWCDHHHSALEDAKKNDFKTSGLAYDGEAGCLLTWKYLFGQKPVPETVQLLSDYDTHKKNVLNWNSHVLPFQFGLRMEETWPSDVYGFGLWEKLLKFDSEGESAKLFTEQGVAALKYKKQTDIIACRGGSFPTVLDGIRCIAINSPGANSQTFESVWDPEMYDAMLNFFWKRGQWTVVMFSDKEDVDVSETAVRHGGGGHKGAAGFQCKNLPFEMK